MLFVKNKTIAILTAFFLILTMTATSILATLPITNAHTPPWTIPTNAYVICTPSTVGLGEYTTIVVWTDRYSLLAGGGVGQRWDGFKIDITKPDGTKEIIGPFKCSSDVGNDFRVYTPDQVGTYTIVFSWPGATVKAESGLNATSTQAGDIYLGATSEPAKLIVQQKPVQGYQESPLPTDYWTRPINALNRGWSTLPSNWLGGSWLVSNFQRWGKAPESAHVLWTKPITPGLAGGINDAAWPGIPSDKNDYESPWSSPIIMNGKIYYNTPSVADVATYGYYCKDLYTGETVWYKNGTDNGLGAKFSLGTVYTLGQSYVGLTQGWLYHYDSVNGQGIVSTLIMVSGTTWYILDASTGNWIMTLTNVPGGTTATGQDGSLLRYSYNSATGNLLCWNISQSIPPLGPVGTNQQQWKMALGRTIDAVNDTTWTQVGPATMTATAPISVPAEAIQPRSGYTMNITVDKNLPGSFEVLQDENRVPKYIFGRSIDGAMSTGSSSTRESFTAWLIRIDEHATAFSPHPEFTATQNNNLGFAASLLYKKEIPFPITGKNYTYTLGGASYEEKVFTLCCAQTRQMWGYDLMTGALLWGPTPSTEAFDMYGVSSNFYYGKVLSCGYGGTLSAYDAQTGKPLWNYNDTAPAYESPYGDDFPLSIGAVCDGKVYLYSTEHSPTKPLWRPWLICLNITDGTEMWKLKVFNMGMSIADGYVVTGNEFDNTIYCIGKGPSATTVSAPQTVPPLGSSVMITGTVTDQSPGSISKGPKLGYLNGAPAVSDASQQAWMEYLYEQQAMPTNAKGVPISLDTIDPNGNYIHIGDVTSDLTGAYGYKWTPDVPGTYQIIATFKGSSSYGSSHAQTYMGVGEVLSTASPYPEIAQPPTETYFAVTGAAIIIAIAIATIIIVLTLRKRT